MLSAFTAVIKELWEFVQGIPPSRDLSLSSTSIPLVNTDRNLARIAQAHTQPVSEVEVSSIESQVAHEQTEHDVHTDVYSPGTMLYVAQSSGESVYVAPYAQFDGVLLSVRFGQAVTLQSYDGRFAQVLVRGVSGYIPKASLHADKRLVNPVLQSGTIYDANHDTTKTIRRLINDEFGSETLSLPLQAGEYIMYRLEQDTITITWPLVRPRNPGLWHTILRGVRGIHTSVVAKTDSVMEWQGDDGDGRVAYVEAVLPDQTLRLSGVGIVVAGEYSVLMVPQVVWREWRPVFITITM